MATMQAFGNSTHMNTTCFVVFWFRSGLFFFPLRSRVGHRLLLVPTLTVVNGATMGHIGVCIRTDP